MFALLLLFACRGPVVVPVADPQHRHPTEWVGVEPEDEDTGWVLPSGDGPALERVEPSHDHPDIHESDGEGGDVSRYDDAYQFRALITVTSDGTDDVTITVPPDWDEFWDNIQSDGDDIRVTTFDGVTDIDYQWASFTYGTRTGVIEVDNYSSVTYAESGVLWLYFGNAAATDGSASFTASTPVDGFIHLGRPGNLVLDVTPDPPGATVPSQRIAKTSTAEIWVWWRLIDLEKRSAPYNRSTSYEELKAVMHASVQTGGMDQSGMYDYNELRMVEGADGLTYIRSLILGGSDGTDYTITFNVVTGNGSSTRTQTARALLEVRDPAEP